MAGDNARKDPSLSSASATRISPCPSLAFDPPQISSQPPMTTVGSRCPHVRMEATMEVVVVFPWAPAMATPYLSLISSASISALGITGIERFFASWIFLLVPFENEPAESSKSPRHGAVFQIGTAYLVAQVDKEFCNSAHSDATDTNKVDVLCLPELLHCLIISNK